MSQQMRRTLATVGLAAALLLAVPAPSRAATFRGPAVAGSLVERFWSWLSSLAQTAPVGQAATPVTRTGNGNGSPPPASPPPSGTNESGSMIDPDGKP